jgi:hypothetical protein
VTVLNFITQNLATILIALALVLICTLIVVKMVRNKKKGKSGCGCGCSGCAMSAMCHAQNNREQNNP